MENVPNSKNYVKETYTFKQLKLTKWAKSQNIDPERIALNVGNHGEILNMADFGTPQKRERFLCGEITKMGKFPILTSFKIEPHRTVRDVRGKMPPPNLGESGERYTDPNYPSLKLPAKEITDHFYDSGVYECQWRDAEWLKTNHPYMGRMSFPENEDKPSRTVMATRSASTREALIYKSEYERKGDGQYRLPTIREVATLMGFPYSYQFVGGEGNKWRQIGNAVSPHLSSVLAKSVRLALGLQPVGHAEIVFENIAPKLTRIENLNDFRERKFIDPPKKNPRAKFRRHPFKDGNMTVALTNFHPKRNGQISEIIEWYSFIFFRTGKDFQIRVIPRNCFKYLAKLIETQHNGQGTAFIQKFEKHFQKSIGSSSSFQKAFTSDRQPSGSDPRQLVDEIGAFILQHEPDLKLMKVPEWISDKQIPTRQVLSMYAINRIIS